jgi:excisionase family DNA binding protein
MTNAQATAETAGSTATLDRPPGDATPEPPAWMSMHEAAAYLGVPYNSLAQHWRKWGVPSYKIGRERKYLQPDLDAWIRAQREGDVIPEQIPA